MNYNGGVKFGTLFQKYSIGKYGNWEYPGIEEGRKNKAII
jgi:hypothetical protein